MQSFYLFSLKHCVQKEFCDGDKGPKHADIRFNSYNFSLFRRIGEIERNKKTEKGKEREKIERERKREWGDRNKKTEKGKEREIEREMGERNRKTERERERTRNRERDREREIKR